MVQIVPRLPTGLEKFLQAFGGVTSGLAQGGAEIGQALQGRKEREVLADKFGEEFKNIRNPDLQRSLLSDKMKIQAEKQKLDLQRESDMENYENYKDIFGERAAKTWLGLGQGERTAFTNALLDAKFRGLDLDKLLNGLGAGSQSTNVVEDLQHTSPDQIIKKDAVPDYKLNTQGMNPKDIIHFQADLRKSNQPIWKESADRLGNYNELSRDIKTLDNLNKRGNLPKKFGKLLINPVTGAPYDVVSAVKDMHPDVQQWVKTIARQATQAQTAFPGRVTNFDLMAYMRQFPSLFNTTEGRDIILKQMELVNQAHQLYEDALNKVYKKYKLSGITPEDADTLAHQMVDGMIAQIDEKLASLAFEGERMSSGGQEGSPQQQRPSLEEIFG
jgi:hypothetical protein